MSRTIMDGDFREWEVFVNTGRSGFARPPRVVFRCVSDGTIPSRMAELPEEPVSAATFVQEAPAEELRTLMEGAAVLS